MASVRKQQRTLLLVLLGACAVMAAAIFFIRSNDAPQAQAGIDKSSITRITITQASGDTIVVERQGEQWQITQPTNQAANSNRIDPLLSVAAIKPSYPSSEVNREAAGLTQPIASIAFNGQVFNIGKADVSDKRRYAEHDGHVYFFPDWIAPLIDSGMQGLAAEP